MTGDEFKQRIGRYQHGVDEFGEPTINFADKNKFG